MAKSTSLGFKENVEAALSYVLGPFTGLAFLILERDNKTVRFHALQSTVFFGILFIAEFILRIVSGFPLIGWIFGTISWMVSVIVVVSIVYLAYSAYTGKEFRIPFIGDVAWAQVNK